MPQRSGTTKEFHSPEYIKTNRNTRITGQKNFLNHFNKLRGQHCSEFIVPVLAFPHQRFKCVQCCLWSPTHTLYKGSKPLSCSKWRTHQHKLFCSENGIRPTKGWVHCGGWQKQISYRLQKCVFEHRMDIVWAAKAAHFQKNLRFSRSCGENRTLVTCIDLQNKIFNVVILYWTLAFQNRFRGSYHCTIKILQRCYL